MENKEAERQFEAHLREHERLIEKICSIYVFTEADRQDLFQEIVIQLWKAYPRFKGESSFGTYLYRIALNTAIAGLRKKKDFIRPYEPEKLPHQADDNDSAIAEEQHQLLYRSIGKLNEVEKAIVLLYLEDKSYREMETILGMTEGALRVKMSRIKDKLRQLTK
ncbi:MAG: polymerase sigma70 factor [Sediminibacterium sp.]|nr:polymerase sigma70 factor [Sediminibacterium sp.]